MRLRGVEPLPQCHASRPLQSRAPRAGPYCVPGSRPRAGRTRKQSPVVQGPEAETAGRGDWGPWQRGLRQMTQQPLLHQFPWRKIQDKHSTRHTGLRKCAQSSPTLAGNAPQTSARTKARYASLVSRMRPQTGAAPPHSELWQEPVCSPFLVSLTAAGKDLPVAREKVPTSWAL